MNRLAQLEKLSRPNRLKRRNRGASLIELMVGMTIGLLVALAATGSLLVTRQGSTTVSDSYRLTTAGNNAMRLIASTIRQAGAAELAQTNQGAPVSFAQMNRRAATLAGDQLVFGTEGGAGTDTLTVSYEHRDPTVTRDCLGNSPGVPPERIDNQFSVNNVELRCLGRRGLANTDIAAAQALVGDNNNANGEVAVEDFQVWYWVQNPADATQSQRVTAAAIAAGAWNTVQTVEVCLQLRGINANYPNPTETFVNCRGGDTAYAGRLHQVFRGVYKLRNRM